jgi:hypothetical protein
MREYYGHVVPQAGRLFTRGKYRLLLPWPAAGTWSVTLANIAVFRERDPAVVTADDGVYSVSVQILTAAIATRRASSGTLAIDVVNQGAPIEQPVFELSGGLLKSHRAEFLPTGLPNRFDIDVPSGAATLALQLRGSARETSPLELHLYDCTTGECFSYDFTVPAAKEQMLEIRNPKAGRWVAAVNAAPFPAASGSFVLDEIVTSGVRRYAATRSGRRLPGERWTETLDIAPGQTMQSSGTPVLLCELVDAAAERDGLSHPWETRKGLTNFAERSVAIGMAISPLDRERLDGVGCNDTGKAPSERIACQPETALDFLPFGLHHHSLPGQMTVHQR